MQDNQKEDNFDDVSMFSKDFEQNQSLEEQNEAIQNIPQEEIQNEQQQTPEAEQQKTDDSNTPVQNSDNSAQFEQESQNQVQEFGNNSPLKKYIMQISSEFVPLIDSMSIDERIAWINDAIQIKIDTQNEQDLKNAKKQITVHFLIIVFVLVMMLPFALILVNKAIMLTFENYKYSQSNFEKLYKQRFEQDTSYLRSLQYNKKHSIK